MKRYLMLILIAVILASGVAGCAPILPEEVEERFFSLAYQAGYSWGCRLTAEDRDRIDLFLTPPDQVDDAQKFNPQVNIRDVYIPKGYWTLEDVADAQFPDGTTFNDKQKKKAMEVNNWGFYVGFMQGRRDCLEGKP